MQSAKTVWPTTAEKLKKIRSNVQKRKRVDSLSSNSRLTVSYCTNPLWHKFAIIISVLKKVLHKCKIKVNTRITLTTLRCARTRTLVRVQTHLFNVRQPSSSKWRTGPLPLWRINLPIPIYDYHNKWELTPIFIIVLGMLFVFVLAALVPTLRVGLTDTVLIRRVAAWTWYHHHVSKRDFV